MSESQITLKAIKRDTGKTAAKAIRNSGKIPAVFYLKNGENIPLTVETLDVRDIVYTSKTKIINLQIEGENDVRECVLKQIDFDPVTDKITHMDFYGIISGTKMSVEVPVKLIGSAKGVREGGIIQRNLRRVQIECLPKDLPTAIEVDVSNLGIGDSLYIKDINIPGVELLISHDTAVASVFVPRVSKEGETPKEAGKTEPAVTPATDAKAKKAE
jgi:large subunit ribosomal protein L25